MMNDYIHAFAGLGRNSNGCSSLDVLTGSTLNEPARTASVNKELEYEM